MNITLTNYEEYFLLLADNELNPAEEIAVRKFAAHYPHLQVELELLFSCRLDADDMPYFPKEILLRTTIWNVENPDPVHTQMVSLLDNELPAAETEKLKQQIAVSPVLQAEWNTLQKAVLPSEAIVYPDKESLYRRQKTRPMVWMRWAAAAAVFAIGWLLWPTENNNGSTIETIAALPVMKTSSSVVKFPNKITLADTGTSQKTDNTVATISTTIKPAQTKQLPKQLKEVAVAYNKNSTATAKNNKANNKEEPETVQPEEIALNEPEIATLPHSNLPAATAVVTNKVSSKTVAFIPKTNLIAPEILQNDIAVQTMEPDDHEGYVHIAGARVDKHKIRGLFRGLTRSVARTFSSSKIKPEDSYATTGK